MHVLCMVKLYSSSHHKNFCFFKKGYIKFLYPCILFPCIDHRQETGKNNLYIIYRALWTCKLMRCMIYYHLRSGQGQPDSYQLLYFPAPPRPVQRSAGGRRRVQVRVGPAPVLRHGLLPPPVEHLQLGPQRLTANQSVPNAA